MAEINDFAVIDDSNTARWPEGMAIAAVNDAGRATEGILGRWYTDDRGIGTVTGSGGAYVLTLNRQVTSLFTGLDVTFRPNHNNPNAEATLNINGLGARGIKVNLDENPGAGALRTNLFAHVRYDGTNWQLLSVIGGPRLNVPNVFTANQTILLVDDGSGLGPTLSLRRDSASPAVSDQIGRLILEGRNSAAEFIAYARIRAFITDPTDGSESGVFTIQTQRAGTPSDRVFVGDGVYTRANGASLADQGEGTANYSAYFARNGFLLPNYIGGLALTNGTDTDHDIDIAAGAAADSTNVEMLPASAARTIAIDNAADRVDGSTLDANTVYYILIGRDGTAAVAGFSKVTTIPIDWEAFRVIGAVVTDASANIINGRFMTVQVDGSEVFSSEQIQSTTGNTPLIRTGLTKPIRQRSLTFVCTGANAGYVPGDRLQLEYLATQADLNMSVSIQQDAGGQDVVVACNLGRLSLPGKNGGNGFDANTSLWAYEVVLQTF
jgi:hypothetical protein